MRESVLADKTWDMTATEDYWTWAEEEYDVAIENGQVKKPIDIWESFEITTICREDLIEAGFDGLKADNRTMKCLAEKIGEAYRNVGFHIDLPIIAEHLEIPKLIS